MSSSSGDAGPEKTDLKGSATGDEGLEDSSKSLDGFCERTRLILSQLEAKAAALAKIHQETLEEIKSVILDLHREVLAASKSLKEREVDLEKKIFISAEKRIEADTFARSNRIVLNVGGQRFETSKANLMRFPNTYFTALLGHGKWSPDTDGSFFIDRDPEHFHLVLKYLRGNDNFLDGISPHVVTEVKAHLDYFLIPLPDRLKSVSGWDPKSFLSTGPRMNGNQVELYPIDNNITIHYMVIAGSSPNPRSFKVKYTSLGEAARVPVFGLRALCPLDGKQWKYNLNVALHTGKTHVTRWDFCNVPNVEWLVPAPRPAYGRIPSGSILEVKVDPISREVRFIINGEDKGLLFALPLEMQEYYGFVGLSDHLSAFELLEST